MRGGDAGRAPQSAEVGTQERLQVECGDVLRCGGVWRPKNTGVGAQEGLQVGREDVLGCCAWWKPRGVVVGAHERVSVGRVDHQVRGCERVRRGVPVGAQTRMPGRVLPRIYEFRGMDGPTCVKTDNLRQRDDTKTNTFFRYQRTLLRRLRPRPRPSLPKQRRGVLFPVLRPPRVRRLRRAPPQHVKLGVVTSPPAL